MNLAKKHNQRACGGGGYFGKSGRFRKVLREYWKCRYLIIMLFICLAHYIVFKYGPMYGVQIAFRDYKVKLGILGSPWNDFENFKMMFRGDGFLKVFRNTIVLSLMQLAVGFPAPIILALMFNEMKNNFFKKAVQTVTTLPNFISWVVIAGILTQVLSPSTGAINYVIKALGFDPIFFLGDNRVFRWTLVISSVWKSVGYGSIIYLATLSGINPELYEAAYIDGATRFKRIWHITIPGLMPVIMIQLIFSIGGILGSDFEQIFNLYNAAVYEVGDVISTYTYRLGLVQLQYGFSTAVGLALNLISFTLIILTNIVTKRFSEYGVW